MSKSDAQVPPAVWEQELKRRLPVYGHRNWIVIADAAYPEQSNPGITTLVADEDQLAVTKRVLTLIAESNHVRPMVYTDVELEFLDESDARGINCYRTALALCLQNAGVRKLPHEEIIAKLDLAARMFSVIIVKTTMTLPYTSVFLELDCGYWNEASEARLRSAIRS
jgi:hypothetical protein